MSLTFYKYIWAKHRDQIIVNSGELPYAISEGNFPNVEDMKNTVRGLLKDAHSFISIEVLVEITKEEYERMSRKTLLSTN